MVLWLSGQATVHAAVAMGLAEHGPNSKDGIESAPRPLDEHFRGEPNLSTLGRVECCEGLAAEWHGNAAFCQRATGLRPIKLARWCVEGGVSCVASQWRHLLSGGKHERIQVQNSSRSTCTSL